MWRIKRGIYHRGIIKYSYRDVYNITFNFGLDDLLYIYILYVVVITWLRVQYARW